MKRINDWLEGVKAYYEQAVLLHYDRSELSFHDYMVVHTTASSRVFKFAFDNGKKIETGLTPWGDMMNNDRVDTVDY